MKDTGKREISYQTFLNLALTLALVLVVLFAFLYLRPRPPAPVDAAVLNTKVALNTPPQWKLDIYGPADQPLRSPMGLTVSPSGEIYVADTGNALIQVFRLAGKRAEPLRRFGGFGRGPGQLNYPIDVAYHRGKVYVAELKGSRLQVFDPSGRPLYFIPDPDKHPGLRFSPTFIYSDGSRLYVSTVNHEVLVFDEQDRLLRRIGQGGGGPGEFSYPYGLVLDEEGRLWVADSNNGRIQVLDREGKPLFSVDGLATPRGLAMDEWRRIYAVDVLQHKVFAFDQRGRLILTFGQRGLEEGELNFPSDIAVWRDMLFIADRENNRISVWGY
jgi:DNA-binding beta-propeller fold protein YncE